MNDVLDPARSFCLCFLASPRSANFPAGYRSGTCQGSPYQAVLPYLFLDGLRGVVMLTVFGEFLGSEALSGDLGPGAQPELLEDLAHVVGRGVLADRERGGDLAVRETLRRETRDLDLMPG
jgi:hypothetical protein